MDSRQSSEVLAYGTCWLSARLWQMVHVNEAVGHGPSARSHRGGAFTAGRAQIWQFPHAPAVFFVHLIIHSTRKAREVLDFLASASA